MEEKPIPSEEWRAIVANVPVVSVDLVIQQDGGVLLGKRENEPAKGEWFVPGGTVLKNELRTEAVQRVAEEELGTTVVIERELGTFEHFYETAEVQGVDSKHYLASAYQCRFDNEDPDIIRNNQHGALEVFHPPYRDLHPYVEQYLDALE